MKALNLFGEVTETEPQKKGKWERLLASRNYRKCENKEERCKNCIHLIAKHYGKIYYKCAIVSDSASASSDIRVNHVCNQFKREKI